ncbi:hypothetical protein QBC46DRAFT_438048 [Diplogelasinospora grovesii]|uniref:Uncharacterized protein n=1 Tax=Diplogelasinospora grovesii TaxID=303347 RepID=A0AAN6S3Q9_9PEZI|nr:hypothetical protein QBC46DRAFT_438048 [Diplogelasinospora grovesii]
MLVSFLPLLALATSALAADPKPPALIYLYSINITIPSTVNLGSVPYGSRGILSISGGSFSGPKMSGKVTVGMDWGLTDTKGTFSPDALYVLQTNDNATIMVTEKGHAPNVQILFETGSSKYAWLNTLVAYATGGPTATGVALDVWQVGS